MFRQSQPFSCASSHAATTSSIPPASRPFVSVNIPLWSPTHSSWCCVAARVIPPRMRWPSGCLSAGPRTAAEAPEPRVREANSLRYSSRVMPERVRRRRVASCTREASSPATTRA
ncbi:Uncharacterised protein [Mycobacteroides abscessus subsp. abscessus]|nr:Uncharacterised protein [Mycobacteroides abscessus subsp. abscessus]